MLEFFGQFLVRTKVISVEQLRDALDMMSRENLLLGQLAVEEGFLSESQANTINREQRYSDKPFGAIGVQMGLLTNQQLEQLLELQNKRRVQVGEALTRLSFITEDRLVQELRRFKAEAERPHIREVTLPGYLHNHRVAEYLLDLVPRVMQRTSRVQCKLDLACEKIHRVDVDVVASVLIRSERTIRCAVASSEEFATRLTQNFFGQAPDVELPPGMLEDGLGEFLNMVAGNAVTGLEQEGIPCEVDPPIRGLPPLDAYVFKMNTTAGEALLLLAE